MWESEGGRSPTVTSVSDLRATSWLSTVPQLSETWQMIMEHVVVCVGVFSRRIASLAIVSCLSLSLSLAAFPPQLWTNKFVS